MLYMSIAKNFAPMPCRRGFYRIYGHKMQTNRHAFENIRHRGCGTSINELSIYTLSIDSLGSANE